MEQGIVLMVVGMATVFAFLVLLVACMQLSSRFFEAFAHWFPEEQPEGTDLAEIAAAVAAVRARIS